MRDSCNQNLHRWIDDFFLLFENSWMLIHDNMCSFEFSNHKDKQKQRKQELIKLRIIVHINSIKNIWNNCISNEKK